METFQAERGDVLLWIQLKLAGEGNGGYSWPEPPRATHPNLGPELVIAPAMEALSAAVRRVPPAPPRPATTTLVDPTTGARTTAGLRRDLRLEIGASRSQAASGDIEAPAGGRTLLYLGLEPLASIRAERGSATADAVLRAVVETCPFALDGGTRVYRVERDGLALLLPPAEDADDADDSADPSDSILDRTLAALEPAVQRVLEVRHLPEVRIDLELVEPPDADDLAEEELGAA